MNIFDIIADPTRRHILDLLRQKPRTVNEVVAALDISQPAVSKQLRILREAGLVTVRQERQKRWYSIQPAPLAELDLWLSPFRQLWAERFDQLDDYLSTLNNTEDEEDQDESPE